MIGHGPPLCAWRVRHKTISIARSRSPPSDTPSVDPPAELLNTSDSCLKTSRFCPKQSHCHPTSHHTNYPSALSPACLLACLYSRPRHRHLPTHPKWLPTWTGLPTTACLAIAKQRAVPTAPRLAGSPTLKRPNHLHSCLRRPHRPGRRLTASTCPQLSTSPPTRHRLRRGASTHPITTTPPTTALTLHLLPPHRGHHSRNNAV